MELSVGESRGVSNRCSLLGAASIFRVCDPPRIRRPVLSTV